MSNSILTIAEARQQIPTLPPGPTEPIVVQAGKIQHFNRPVLLMFAAHGDIISAEINGVPTIAVQQPETVDFILSDRNHDFNHGYGDGINTIFSGGLPVLPYPLHRDLRPEITPSFNPSNMGQVFVTIQSIIDNHIDSWTNLAEFNCLDACTTMTLDVIASLIGLDQSEYHTYGELYRFLSAGMFYPLGTPKSLKAVESRKLLAELISRVIADRQASPKNDITSLMLAAGLSHEQILDQNIVLGFAGHETQKTVLSAAIMELGQNPGLKNGISSERISPVKSKARLTYRPTENMSITNRIILATLLTHGPISVVPRISSKDVTLPNGFTIPKGWDVKLMIEAMHHNIFGDISFAPERFLHPTEQERKYFMPFGLGPHFCLGMGFAMQEIYFALQKLTEYSWESKPAHNQRTSGDIIVTNFKPQNQ